MNGKPQTYALSSDSTRWWWPSAAAGAMGTAAIGAIFVLPSAGHAIPVDDIRPMPVVAHSSVSVADPMARTRPCFMVRAQWNTVLDGQQPRCGGPSFGLPRTTAETTSGAMRPGLAYLP